MVVGSVAGTVVTVVKGKEKSKDRMHVCFDRARLYLKQKVNGKDFYVYPTVTQSVKLSDHDAYYFTLPIGVNPLKVHNYLWVFKQGFGDYVDIEGENSMFILRAFKAPIQSFDYDFDSIPLDGRIPIVIGRSRRSYVVYDMVENPHLLIAGETGSGKSTALRAILTTIIKNCPDVELYCADLKRSEFHLFKPYARDVVVETDDLKEVLGRICAEMTKRGDMCDEYGVASIYDLPFKVPTFILAIDELAMLKKEKDIMKRINDIAAIGRALGVFLILSMQRPDADVLDGKIKANLTVRLAFRHADELNSRITLGHGGAEHIKQSEKGRGLIKLDGVTEIQSPYLSLERAREILKG